jgi:hypothetical protein
MDFARSVTTFIADKLEEEPLEGEELEGEELEGEELEGEELEGEDPDIGIKNEAREFIVKSFERMQAPDSASAAVEAPDGAPAAAESS